MSAGFGRHSQLGQAGKCACFNAISPLLSGPAGRPPSCKGKAEGGGDGCFAWILSPAWCKLDEPEISQNATPFQTKKTRKSAPNHCVCLLAPPQEKKSIRVRYN